MYNKKSSNHWNMFRGVSLALSVLTLSLAVSYFAFAWTEPNLAPPGCNPGDPGCDAPINVGLTDQSKKGRIGIGGVFAPLYSLDIRNSIGLGTLRTTGGAILNTGGAATGLIVQNGNVGIGTNNPQNKLDVEGGAVIGATYSGTNVAPANGLLVEGSVGIGTTTPTAGRILDVNGPVIFSGNTEENGIYIPNNDILVKGADDRSFGIRHENDPAKDNRISFGSNCSDNFCGVNDPWTMSIDTFNNRVGIGYFAAAGVEFKMPQTLLHVHNGNVNGTVLAATDGGNVGVGTLAPNAKLEVNGGVRLNTTAGKPACDGSKRGTLWFTQSAAGVKDIMEVCAKDAADAYAWRILY